MFMLYACACVCACEPLCFIHGLACTTRIPGSLRTSCTQPPHSARQKIRLAETVRTVCKSAIFSLRNRLKPAEKGPNFLGGSAPAPPYCLYGPTKVDLARSHTEVLHFSAARPRGGEPAHADPALAHAMAGAGRLAAALSGIVRRRQPRLAAAGPSILRRCCCVIEATRRRRGA